MISGRGVVLGRSGRHAQGWGGRGLVGWLVGGGGGGCASVGGSANESECKRQ